MKGNMAPKVFSWGLPGQAQLPVSAGSSDIRGSKRIRDRSPNQEQADEARSDEEIDTNLVDVETLQVAMFGQYEGSAMPGAVEEQDPGVAKICSLLVAAKSGATACLICLERVHGADEVWDCKSGCHAIFHLICIQAWAQHALNAAEQNFRGVAANAGRWHCPKCRAEYARSQIPKEYRCFCGKAQNPERDPWLTPHTCGEQCDRTLEGSCEHKCKLLCHPGRCPPCPQLIEIACFCGRKSEVRRCGRRNFSCGTMCGKFLVCRTHACQSVCHEGPCPPCTKTGLYSCRCKSELSTRVCAISDFQCERLCQRALSCKKHLCEQRCHSGTCGECELAGRRSCPCGKLGYTGMPCDASIPSCGSTCEKSLTCGLHRCQERCHPGPCKGTCRIVVAKPCRCGGLKKQVPCHQELLCERKCQRIRDCTRHACKRRCCDGDCPPCLEVCGRRLRCGNHKCPAPCHRGLCAPCPVTVHIPCACGTTVIDVPCGIEKDQKPPLCSKLCQIIPRCSHSPKSHRCHYGACPPCQRMCGLELSCGHQCPRKCHGPKPNPNPEYSLVKKRKKPLQIIPDCAGSPCPACAEVIVGQCLGQHYGVERLMLCSEAKDFQCENICGNLQACGNHFCQKPCHAVQKSCGSKTNHEYEESLGSVSVKEVDACQHCDLACQKVHSMCSHPCPLVCHPGLCPPCKILVKKTCYCDTLVHAFECSDFYIASEEQQTKMLSCGGPCHRKLPNCIHLCPDVCHPGACPTANYCQKKVAVRCACGRQKREWLCSDVQAAVQGQKPCQKVGMRVSTLGLLACDEECLKKAHRESELLRHRKATDLEPKFSQTTLSKRQKNRRHGDVEIQRTKLQELWASVEKWTLIICVFVLLFLVVFYGVRGLWELNAWMNKLDATRPRRRLPGSSVLPNR